ncbi:MAG TPA: nitroreductase/quinone reductase family protein [Acidimicrobiales bacterium]|nr:nitroreductase/quinone reductase family protein [Acidimicrobiales bacterium]
MAQGAPLHRRLLDAFNRRFTKFHTAVYGRSGGWLGHRMTGPVTSLLLESTGRRTGLPRAVALAYSRDGDDLLVVASNFGGDRPPAWLANVRARPEVTVRVGHRHLPVTAEVVLPGEEDYDRLFAVADRGTRGRYSRYVTMTDRPIPIVRLRPRH